MHRSTNSGLEYIIPQAVSKSASDIALANSSISSCVPSLASNALYVLSARSTVVIEEKLSNLAISLIKSDIGLPLLR